VERPAAGYYADPGWTNHAVAVFAKYYLRAFDAGRRQQLLRRAAGLEDGLRRGPDGRVSAAGNFFLGLNAHINHDLALAMAAAGLTGPDGARRRPTSPDQRAAQLGDAAA
jgi:hypothetical protein